MAAMLSDFYGAKRNTIISHFVKYCFFNFTDYFACHILLFFKKENFLKYLKT